MVAELRFWYPAVNVGANAELHQLWHAHLWVTGTGLLKLLKFRKTWRYCHNLGQYFQTYPKALPVSGVQEPEESLRMAQQQQPQQPGTLPTPAGGTGTNGPNMSQMIMQMMAQLTQGQHQLNQEMTEAMSQQLQINRNVERSAEYKDRSELRGIQTWQVHWSFWYLG